MLSIFLFFMSFSLNAQDLSCEDYEKSIKPKDAWIQCNLGSGKNVGDLYISVDKNGKRESINFSAGKKPESFSSISNINPVEAIEISENKIELKLHYVSYPNIEPVKAKLSVQRDRSQDLFDLFAFSGRLKLKGQLLGDKITCGLRPVAYYESDLFGCEDFDLTDLYQSHLRRSCANVALWHHVFPGIVPQTRMHFKQDPITLHEKCVVDPNPSI